MTDASVYLHFHGNCADAMRFYEQLLGGRLEMRLHKDSMPAEHIPPGMSDKVLHAHLQLNRTSILASDTPPGYTDRMSGFAVSLSFADRQEAQRVFDALARDGKVTMAFAQTFWSPGFGMCEDRFGTPWMVNTENEAGNS